MHAEPYCLACFNTELSLLHGVLVCNACGTQAETFVEEEEFLDAPGGAQGGSFRRRRMVVPGGSGSAPQIHQDALADRALEQSLIRGQALAYTKCLQALIQAQAHVLVDQLGLPPGIRTLLRRLWLSHLPLTGVLELSIEQVWVCGPDRVCGVSPGSMGAESCFPHCPQDDDHCRVCRGGPV